jgi:hypothetical protein
LICVKDENLSKLASCFKPKFPQRPWKTRMTPPAGVHPPVGPAGDPLESREFCRRFPP